MNGNATPVFTNTFTLPSNRLDRVKKVWLGNSPTKDKICDFALGNFKMYAKALTPEEALQNYKASIVFSTKSQVKDIVAQSTDFNDFKTRIQNW